MRPSQALQWRERRKEPMPRRAARAARGARSATGPAGRTVARTVGTAVLLCAAALYGCAIGPNYKRPAMEMPRHYKNAAPATSAAAPPDRWWTLFNDPTLDRLIEEVDVSNQNLREAVAAYEAAVEVIRQDRASFLPSISVDASGERIKSGTGTSVVSSFGSVASSSGTGRRGGSTTSSVYQLSGTATWELDVWGQLRRTLESASETARADQAELANARLSAQDELATAYLELRGADAEIALLSQTVAAYRRTLTITMNRYKVGTVAKSDVLEAETSVYNAQQQEAATRLQRAQLEDAIAALVGKPASDFRIAPRAEWSIPIPDIPASMPSALLERRPDIEAAEHQVAAANAQIGVQEASYFPQLSLSGTYGFLSGGLGTLFQAVNASREAALSASDTIFNFGATHAKVAQARAQYREEVAAYFQTILTAFQDVENDLAAIDLDKRQYDVLKKESDAADENERLTLNEYKAGTVDFTTVVVAQASALSARLSLAQITVSEQTAAVSLVTDLGGGWKPASAAR
jgi:NodT family efflux transporter outer membrane factor (OMF) lipoprotein